VRAQLLADAAQYIQLERSVEDEQIEAMIEARKASQTNAQNCSNCGENTASGSRFCPQCGTAFGNDCPSCGKPAQTVIISVLPAGKSWNVTWRQQHEALYFPPFPGVCLAFSVLPFPVLAQTDSPPEDSGTGIVLGKIINQNKGNLVTGSLDVMLHILGQGYVDLGMEHGKSEADGTFKFSSVVIRPRAPVCGHDNFRERHLLFGCDARSCGF
jgi:hypothetical protein